MKADELIREVEEELQRDKLLAFAKRYGGYMLAAGLLVLVATVAWVVWQNWQARQRMAEADTFAAAQSLAAKGDLTGAAKSFASLAEDAGSGFGGLARFRAAQALLSSGDRPAAIAELDALAKDNAADGLLRGLAVVQSAGLQLDTAAPADLRAKLEPQAVAGQPWRYQAQELLALIAIRAGDEARAREILAALAEDAGTPANLRRRAGELRDALAGGLAGS